MQVRFPALSGCGEWLDLPIVFDRTCIQKAFLVTTLFLGLRSGHDACRQYTVSPHSPRLRRVAEISFMARQQRQCGNKFLSDPQASARDPQRQTDQLREVQYGHIEVCAKVLIHLPLIHLQVHLA